MKLRNKQSPDKLGEIVPYDAGKDGGIAVKTDQGIVWYYHSLAELNEEWEDYEEPKEYWYIKHDGCITITCGGPDDDMKQIGNYFETKEETELAVRKLKAWKRLEDKGFRFCGWATNEGIRGVDFEVPDSFFSEHNHSCISDETRVDLDLLFGGEE